MSVALVAAILAVVSGPKVAVLEFDAGKIGSDIDRTYFSDLVRGGVHKAAPQLFVMTRESTEALLKASGKSLADCTGECEVETGRMLGADYVVSGRITKVGTRIALTLRLHSTVSGELIGTAEARGKTIDELVDATPHAADELLAPLAPKPAACGTPQQCMDLALPLYQSAEFARAPPLLEPACAGGIAEACSKLGFMLRDGTGIAKDAVRARALLTTACEGGSASGCWNLGGSLLSAEGGPIDRPRGIESIQRACDLGKIEACTQLGAFLSSSGIPAEVERGAALLKRGCDGGNLEACNDYGDCFENGRGVAQDYARAIELYRGACDKNLGIACAGLASLNRTGHGLAKNIDRADALDAEHARRDTSRLVQSDYPVCGDLSRG